MISKDITVVGSIALDSLETPKGARSLILGGSAMYFSLSASLFSSVEVVGVVGTDFPKEGWEIFKSHNINYDNVEIKDGKTFSWGGRYSDNYSKRTTLFTNLGGKATPAVGFAAGLERLIMILKDKQKNIISNNIDIYIISLNEESISYAFAIADKLRNTLGIKVVCETLRRSMKSQLREANKNNAKFTILVGENEINNEKVTIKNMEDGTQTDASIDEIENYFGVDYEYK